MWSSALGNHTTRVRRKTRTGGLASGNGLRTYARPAGHGMLAPIGPLDPSCGQRSRFPTEL